MTLPVGGPLSTVAEGKLPPSEFGGDPGLIQPVDKGHLLEPEEELMMQHATNPMDPAATPDPEQVGSRRSGFQQH